MRKQLHLNTAYANPKLWLYRLGCSHYLPRHHTRPYANGSLFVYDANEISAGIPTAHFIWDKHMSTIRQWRTALLVLELPSWDRLQTLELYANLQDNIPMSQVVVWNTPSAALQSWIAHE